MRLVLSAPAVAIVLLTAAFGLPGASASSGSIVSPAPGGELERADDVTVTFSPFPIVNNSTSVEIVVRLDGVPIGAATHPHSTTNVTLDVPVLVPSNITSRERTLSATFTSGGRSTTTAQRVQYVGGPADQPPALVVTSATYVVGMGFRVVGEAIDDEHVSYVSVQTTYGTRWLARPNASFVFDVPANPTQLGPHWMRVRAYDGAGQNTTVDLIADVVGERVTVYEQAVRLDPAGLHVAPYRVGLPHRLLDGAITVQCSGSCVGAVTLDIDADNHTVGCGAVFAPINGTSGPCPFRTHDGTGVATIAWTQARGSIAVAVVGTRV